MSAGARRPSPLRFRLVTLGSTLELLEHVGGTRLVATIHWLPVTQRDRPYGRTGREGGRRAVVSSAPEIGSLWSMGKWRELPPCLVSVQLRAGRQGQGPGRENSLTPSLPP
jgi:hypothetical protein